MKCHYEVLGLPRTADGDEIKKSYRKLALRWHPDKNLDNPEEANQQFLLVQAAYDVLSDPQERAWYDNHREQILRGGHTDYEDNSLDVFPYFTTSCYKGYGDDPGGFYAVYAEVFDTLAAEELEFLDTEEECETIPKFGNGQSDYETVVRLFYGFWEGFCTKKSYAWLNPHNVAEIRDRRILKAIEKENKKIQQKARKERNEEIRSLVLFVKKRDRRVQAYKKLLEDKASQNRLKSQQNRLEQIRRNQLEIEEQQRNSSNLFDQAYEEQLRKKLEAETTEDETDVDGEDGVELNGLEDAMVGLIVGQNENGEESFYVDDLYCVACDKMFSNRSSYENHESSKKHKQNVELLRKQMREESQEFDQLEETVSGEAEATDLPNDKHAPSDDVAPNGSDIEEEPSETVEKSSKSKQKKNKSKKKALNNAPVIKSSDDEDPTNGQQQDFEMTGLRLGRKTAVDSDDDDDWASGSKKPNRKGKAKPGTTGQKTKGQAKGPANTTPQAEIDQKPVETTAAKKGSLKDVGALSDEDGPQQTDHSCVTCKEKFSSKNKLFDHLKKTGHSVYIDKLKASKAATGGKGEGTKVKRKGK
uniref:DnaJ homolog subfamily C member 21 n=1 Tax=Anopheles atroparvus TaxID=41427 RepID=A0AAG5DER6_ANOAO